MYLSSQSQGWVKGGGSLRLLGQLNLLSGLIGIALLQNKGRSLQRHEPELDLWPPQQFTHEYTHMHKCSRRILQQSFQKEWQPADMISFLSQ